jgi:HAD superfamily hydrolase (TIGR01458 family)
LKGVLLDIDGVLVVSWKPLPGAAECLRWLQESAVQFRLVTNTSSKSRREIAAVLADVGLPIDPDHISTAVSSAADFLAEHHGRDPCFVLNEGSLDEELAGVIQTSDPSLARVVLLGGAGTSMGYREFDTVFKLARDGIPVVALNRNTRFQTVHGSALDMGAFILGIEAAANVKISVFGKPSPDFFASVLRQMDIVAGQAVMVGDDLQADVLGAQSAGISGVLVRTGKFDQRELSESRPAPDHVIDGIGLLPDLLKTLGLE